MEKLKALLKLAFAKSAYALQLKVNEVPRLSSVLGTEALPGVPVVDHELIQTLYEVLFPLDKEAIENSKPTNGSLTVVDKGKINLIATPGPLPGLSLYFSPGGDNLYNEHWAQIDPLRKTITPPIAKMPLAPPSHNPSPMQAVQPKSPNQQSGIKSGINLFASPSNPPAPSPPSPAAVTPPPIIATPLRLSTMDDGERKSSEETGIEPSNGFVPSTKFQPPPPSSKQRFSLEDQPLIVKGMEPELISSPPLPRMMAPDPTTKSSSAVPKAFSIEDAPLDFAPISPIKVATPNFAPIKGLSPLEAADQSFPNAKSAAEATLPQMDMHSLKQNIHYGPVIPSMAIQSGEHEIDQLLLEMLSRKASDLHLTLGYQACFRIDGEIIKHGSLVITEALMRQFLDPIIPRFNRDEFLSTNDTDFSYDLPGHGRFRVNIFRDRNGVGAVLRQIPNNIISADQLNLPKSVRNLTKLNKGLVIVTGPTGSGKTTTLAAMIDLINSSRKEHILTIEDPIEFIHPQQNCLINQREINRHTTSFSRALRAALREDPDIVMIGEMRDLETISIALETAETGHLVFGTLHTNTAISTIDRIIDQFPTSEQAQVRVMLSETLKGVVAQTLCKRRGGGRVAAHEVLVINTAVSSMIREGKTMMIANVMQTQRNEGNILLNDSLATLVVSGLIDPKEAWFRAVDRDGLLKLLQSKGVAIDTSDVKSA